MIVLCNPMSKLGNFKPKGKKGLGWESVSYSGLFWKGKKEKIMSGLVTCEQTFYIYTMIQTCSVLYLVTRIKIWGAVGCIGFSILCTRMCSFNCEMHFIFLMRKGTTNYLSAKQYYKKYNQHALINIVRHCVNVLYIFPRCWLYTFIALVSLMNWEILLILY